MNSENVETWHSIIISLTACAKKLRGLRQKLDALRVQNGQSLSKYQGSYENSSVTKGFHFFELI